MTNSELNYESNLIPEYLKFKEISIIACNYYNSHPRSENSIVLSALTESLISLLWSSMKISFIGSVKKQTGTKLE